MKSFFYFFLLSLVFSAACNRPEPVFPSNEPTSTFAEEEKTCSENGVVQQNDCGFFIEIDEDTKVYATSYPGKFRPQSGMEVSLSFDYVSCVDRTSRDKTHVNSDSEQCMYDEGISIVTISCLTITDGNGDIR